MRVQNDGSEVTIDSSAEPIVKRIRLDFTSPSGALRPLLLGFIPNNLATDDFDYGYDAMNSEFLPNDLSWSINEANYIIQGVGDFDASKYYPLNLLLSDSGTIEISLNALEHFETDIDVFVYDALLDIYTKLNDIAFEMNLGANEYQNRFYITFIDEGNALSNPDVASDNSTINYLNDSKEIYIKMQDISRIDRVQIINLIGQTVKTWDANDFVSSSQVLRIPVDKISDGSYVVKVYTNSGVINKKVIIKQ